VSGEHVALQIPTPVHPTGQVVNHGRSIQIHFLRIKDVQPHIQQAIISLQDVS
jgi:hypothetical protein